MCAVILALLVNAAFASPAAQAETLRTSGTGAALGTMRVLADAYRKVDPQFSLEIVPNLGSRGSLKALEQNAIHFAMISRPASPEEAARGLVATEYGRTPFVLASARKDSAGLTLASIADIYAGKSSKWPDGTPIRLVLRPANDGDTPVLAAFSPAVKEGLAIAMAREGMIVGVTDQDSANEIARLKGGLGTTSLALILSENRPLFPLPIDGVTPSVQALADGTYPYFKPLYLVTRGKPPEALARFFAFIESREGRRILTETGNWVDQRNSAKAASR